MNDLDKMNPEIAARIILLHTNDELKELHGSLDDLTTTLFKVPIPTFDLDSFAYSSSPAGSITAFIKVLYPGDDKATKKIKIHIEALKKVRGCSYRIEYKVIEHSNWKGLPALSANWIGTPLIRTDVAADIFLDIVYYGIGVYKVFTNFLEALFLREFLTKRQYKLGDGDEKYPFDFKYQECTSLLVGFGELLVPQNQKQLKLWIQEQEA